MKKSNTSSALTQLRNRKYIMNNHNWTGVTGLQVTHHSLEKRCCFTHNSKWSHSAFQGQSGSGKRIVMTCPGWGRWQSLGNKYKSRSLGNLFGTKNVPILECVSLNLLSEENQMVYK